MTDSLSNAAICDESRFDIFELFNFVFVYVRHTIISISLPGDQSRIAPMTDIIKSDDPAKAARGKIIYGSDPPHFHSWMGDALIINLRYSKLNSPYLKVTAVMPESCAARLTFENVAAMLATLTLPLSTVILMCRHIFNETPVGDQTKFWLSLLCYDVYMYGKKDEGLLIKKISMRDLMFSRRVMYGNALLPYFQDSGFQFPLLDIHNDVPLRTLEFVAKHLETKYEGLMYNHVPFQHAVKADFQEQFLRTIANQLMREEFFPSLQRSNQLRCNWEYGSNTNNLFDKPGHVPSLKVLSFMTSSMAQNFNQFLNKRLTLNP